MMGGEGLAMETEFYQAAILVRQVLALIELCVDRMILARSLHKVLKDVLRLRADALEMLEKIFFLADTVTNMDLRSVMKNQLVFGRGLDLEPEFDVWAVSALAEAHAARSIGNRGNSREIQSQIATTVGGESKGSAMEVVELQQARADSEIGDIFKKMLLKIYKSEEARSMEVRKRGSYQLDSIFFHFDQMWGHGRQLQQLSSTDATFLATSMLTHDMLVGHVSTLELCSEHIDWLCTWVPQFGEKLKMIKKDNTMANKMIGMTKQEVFDAYIRRWERVCRRNKSIRFEDSTTLSSMLFTHYMPGHHPLFAGLTQTMQIFSIKITGLELPSEWPLEVYGVVAVRDAVDYRRNHLFLRSRDNCQLLNDEDSYLHLTGPSRAIMSRDTVRIEFQLKVKGTIKSEDRPLVTKEFACGSHGAGTSIMRSIDGSFCKLELCYEHFRGSIQATIISICVTQGSLSNGAEVICFSLPEEDAEGKDERTTNHVVLFDKKNGAVPVDDGYLKLSRQVVPVQFEGKLKVVVKTDVMSKTVAFTPELSNISREQCTLGDDCTLEITVAWSLLVNEEQHMMMMSYMKALMLPEKFPYMNLDQDTEGRSC